MLGIVIHVAEGETNDPEPWAKTINFGSCIVLPFAMLWVAWYVEHKRSHVLKSEPNE